MEPLTHVKGATSISLPCKIVAVFMSVVLTFGLSPLGQTPTRALADEGDANSQIESDEKHTINLWRNDDNGTVSTDLSEAAEGETVSLTIEPSDGYKISQVDVFDSEYNPISVATNTFIMPASDVFVNVYFSEDVPELFSIIINDTWDGAVTANVEEAEAGDTVSLEITPDDGYELYSLRVSEQDTGNEVAVNDGYSFTMPNDNVIVTAEFRQITYKIEISTASGGKLTALEDAWDDEEITEAAEGELVYLRAEPNPGYEPISASYAYVDNDSSLERSEDADAYDYDDEGRDKYYTFEMPAADVTVSAEFIEKQHAIEISDDYEGGAVEANDTRANAGDEVTLVVMPDAGWRVNSIGYTYTPEGATEPVSVSLEDYFDYMTSDVVEGIVEETYHYSFKMPAASISVEADFAQMEHEITIADEIVGGSVISNTRADSEDWVEVFVTPDPGFRASKVTYSFTDAESGNAVTQPIEPDEDGEYYFQMPDADVTLNAEFAQKRYAISIANDIENGKVEANDIRADEGDTVYVYARSPWGYKSTGVTYAISGGGSRSASLTDYDDYDLDYDDDYDYIDVYRFTMPAADVELSATFKEAYYVDCDSEGDEGEWWVNPNWACEGETVTLTVVPEPGYAIGLVSCSYREYAYVDSDYGYGYDSVERPVPVTNRGNGVYTFTMPAHDVEVGLVFKKVSTSTTAKPNANNTKTTTTTTTAPTAKAATNQSTTVAGATAKVDTRADGTATVTSATVKSGGSVTVDTVTVGGVTYKVTEIAANALKGSKAKSVTIGDSVTEIGANALANTKKLTSLTIGKSVKKAGKNVLKGSKVKKVTLKSSKLNKKNFKNLFKKSKVKTIKLKGVSKKAKKNYKKWAKALKIKVK